MKYLKITSFLIVLFAAAGLMPLKGQIAISPSFVFINSKTGVGDVYISNSSDQSYEVTLSFAFGYPTSDSLGNLLMNYNDPTAFEQFALDSMIRVFPRSFILPGKEQRTARIQILPSERKREGFFFTRMKVTAKPQTVDVTEQIVAGVSTRISFNFEQITAVFYYHGDVTTGLIVKELEVNQVDSTLQLRPHLQRTGNSPFIGSMVARLKDSKGNVMAETRSSTTAYFDVIRSMDLKIIDVPAGTYMLELSFETHRNDMKDKNLVQAPAIVMEQGVVIR